MEGDPNGASGQMSIFKRNSKKEVARRGVIVGTEASYMAAGLDFGVAVSPDAALKMTAYQAGVRLIAENIAALPKDVFFEGAHGKASNGQHPAFRAINVRPNAYTNVFDFWFVMTAWLEYKGNAYALIQGPDQFGNIELHQLDPDWVDVRIVDGHKWYKVECPDPNRAFLSGTWPDRKVLHFMQFTTDGIVGINPIIYNAIALGKGMAVEKLAADYYRKGGNIRGVMETENSLGDDAYNQFMAHFNAAGNFGTPLLEYGIKYKQLTVDAVAAKLIESETFSVDDIARMLNIPPHMLAEMSHSTFSNIEHQTIQFVQYTLRPIVKRFEVELESKLFHRPGYDVKFVLDGLLRGDTAARTAYYHGAVLDGYMSRNEVRAMEGLPYREGLDDMLYPINEGVVGKEPETPKE